MVESKKKVDQRLVNLYLMRKAHQKGHIFGFENDLIVERNLKARVGVSPRKSSSNDFAKSVYQSDLNLLEDSARLSVEEQTLMNRGKVVQARTILP